MRSVVRVHLSPFEKHKSAWGRSSVGRAPALQAGGQEFESLHLHLYKTDDLFVVLYSMYLENHILKRKDRIFKEENIKTSEGHTGRYVKEEKTNDQRNVTLYIRGE